MAPVLVTPFSCQLLVVLESFVVITLSTLVDTELTHLSLASYTAAQRSHEQNPRGRGRRRRRRSRTG